MEFGVRAAGSGFIFFFFMLMPGIMGEGVY